MLLSSILKYNKMKVKIATWRGLLSSSEKLQLWYIHVITHILIVNSSVLRRSLDFLMQHILKLESLIHLRTKHLAVYAQSNLVPFGRQLI